MAVPASFMKFAQRTLVSEIRRLWPGLADRTIVNRTPSSVRVSKSVFRFFSGGHFESNAWFFSKISFVPGYFSSSASMANVISNPFVVDWPLIKIPSAV